MATTKRTLVIMTNNDLDDAIDIQGNGKVFTFDDLQIPAAERTTDAVTGDVIIDVSARPNGFPSNADVTEYAAAQAGTITVDFSALITVAGATTHDEGIDFEVTLIDVTNGREKFPRRTLTAPTVAALATAIHNMTIQAEDGKQYQAAVDSNNDKAIEIQMPDNVLARAAASDGAVITDTAPTFSTGFTRAEAVEYAKNVVTQQYGRTNRIKFPVIEPEFLQAITATTYDVMRFDLVSETKFDKNFGAGYHDMEQVIFLIPRDAVDGTNVLREKDTTP